MSGNAAVRLRSGVANGPVGLEHSGTSAVASSAVVLFPYTALCTICAATVVGLASYMCV